MHCDNLQYLSDRGIRGKFLRGGKVIFPDFFLAWNAFSQQKISILVDPKQISVVLKSEKQKKKKKKGPLLILQLFLLPFIFNFPPFPTFPFKKISFFFLHFPFFLTSLFLVGQQKFPGQKCLGHSAPTYYATALRIKLHSCFFVQKNIIFMLRKVCLKHGS